MNISLISKKEQQALAAMVFDFRTTRSSAIFSVIYNHYHQRIYAYCRKITGDREDALDLTAETFIKAYEKIDQLDQPENFASWLFRIARNKSLDCLRSRKKARETIEQQIYFGETDEDTEENYLKEEADLKKLQGWLQKLPAEDREILEGKYLHHKSLVDLQDQFHISSSAIKMRLFRAKKKMVRLSMSA